MTSHNCAKELRFLFIPPNDLLKHLLAEIANRLYISNFTQA